MVDEIDLVKNQASGGSDMELHCGPRVFECGSVGYLAFNLFKNNWEKLKESLDCLNSKKKLIFEFWKFFLFLSKSLL